MNLCELKANPSLHGETLSQKKKETGGRYGGQEEGKERGRKGEDKWEGERRGKKETQTIETLHVSVRGCGPDHG